MAAVVVALAGVILWLALRRDRSDYRPLGEFEVAWRIAPSGDPASQRQPSIAPAEVAIFLDVSRPVGGFLPPPAAGPASSPFRIWLNAVPPQLVQLAGRGSPRVGWYGVSAQVRGLAAPPPLSRALFDGARSRLDAAIVEMQKGLASGRVGAAVLLTDLIATGDFNGALQVGTELGEWIERSRREASDLHFALVGVRAPYTGVATADCPLQAGLGCWFSEQAGRFHRLSAPAKVPFYALLVGHGAQATGLAARELAAAATGLGFESQVEVLTEAAEPSEEKATCRAQAAAEPHLPQLLLRRDPQGRFRCSRDGVVELSCPLPGALGKPLSANASWPEVASVRLDETQVHLLFDCSKAHARPPTGELTLRLEGPPHVPTQVDWTAWSTASDERPADLGKTLQLLDFLVRVRYRPASRVARSSTILRSDSPRPPP